MLPGREAFARLKLAHSALLLPGDRFIIRQFSPVVTIGGGVVLDGAPIPRMRELNTFLNILEGCDAEATLTARIARRKQEGISIPRLVAETGWSKKTVAAELAPALKAGTAVQAGELLLERSAVEALKLRIVSTAANFHQKNPLVGGIGKEDLRMQVDAIPEVFEAVCVMLVRDKKLEVISDLVRLPGHGVVMKDEEAESKHKIEDAFASAGLQVPALNDVVGGLKIDKVRAQKIVTLLLRDKALVKISEELVFHRNALDELRLKMASYKARSKKIDVAAFKELTGVTRKYAIPLLEYLDRERITKRVGDMREIL